MNRSIIAAAGIGLLLLIAAALLWTPGDTPPPPDLVNVILPKAKPMAPFRLMGDDGRVLTADSLQGKWTFFFFGYTHCPDVCPTTLLSLQGLRKRLDAHPRVLADTQFLFISVDPKRDTPEQLKKYVGFFHDDFRAATGEKSEIDRLVELSGAVYMFEGDTTGSDYVVNHSASIYLADPKGRVYAWLTPPHVPEEMVATYLKVRKHYGDL